MLAHRLWLRTYADDAFYVCARGRRAEYALCQGVAQSTRRVRASLWLAVLARTVTADVAALGRVYAGAVACAGLALVPFCGCAVVLRTCER